jgi:hypothetical protein
VPQFAQGADPSPDVHSSPVNRRVGEVRDYVQEA